MNASLQIPFALGEPVWWVGHAHQETMIVCPECAGTKVLTVVQGNGDQIEVPCACCGDIIRGSSGRIKQVVYKHVPQLYTPRRVTGFYDGGVQYTDAPDDATCYGTINSKDMFATETECAMECGRRNIEREIEQEQQLIRNLSSKRKDMAWSVHYWDRKVKDLERDLEVARRWLGVCKERAAVKGPVAADRKAAQS